MRKVGFKKLADIAIPILLIAIGLIILPAPLEFIEWLIGIALILVGIFSLM